MGRGEETTMFLFFGDHGGCRTGGPNRASSFDVAPQRCMSGFGVEPLDRIVMNVLIVEKRERERYFISAQRATQTARKCVSHHTVTECNVSMQGTMVSNVIILPSTQDSEQDQRSRPARHIGHIERKRMHWFGLRSGTQRGGVHFYLLIVCRDIIFTFT